MNASRRACLLTGPAMLAVALVACSSPATLYYRLMAVPGAVQTAAPMTVAVRSVSIPGYLNRDGIAKAGAAYRFEFYSNDLWADQLSAMLQAIMVQDLAQRLPAATVLASGGSIEASSDVLVEINILRFDPDSSGNLVLSAQIAIKSGPTRRLWATQSFARSSALSLSGAGADGPDAAEIVAKMSALWAAMADQVAALIAQYQAARPGAGSGSG
ncbi:MAG TPA: PqiC family protein [Acidocella sp.]|nr:PqiC family protein [Acidocella sp.]